MAPCLRQLGSASSFVSVALPLQVICLLLHLDSMPCLEGGPGWSALGVHGAGGLSAPSSLSVRAGNEVGSHSKAAFLEGPCAFPSETYGVFWRFRPVAVLFISYCFLPHSCYVGQFSHHLEFNEPQLKGDEVNLAHSFREFSPCSADSRQEHHGIGPGGAKPSHLLAASKQSRLEGMQKTKGQGTSCSWRHRKYTGHMGALLYPN